MVHDIVDLHTEYLCDPLNDATVLPYFEGDYWVNEAEAIIKDLKEGKGPKEIVITDDDFTSSKIGAVEGGGEEECNNGSKNDVTSKKSKRKSKSKLRISRTVSSGSTSYKERDPVMAKLANIIEPMKDTFFVARLHPREYAEKYALKRY